ncbi:multidrug ABC transporter ATP-binding protein [Paenibacillus sp. CAA11]|uniref:ABC transporter ATP-binding protein n=1 Tax=Paenibacillus sp. CAA11 TaxID=1532905 RepID=UPI000D35995F|nr:ABC transporter ATP-binding protein [Paenibacillus sp. CAA11]AWB46688.1 multidrug ABC transporter ATP-binding protein [Paenibacillus sp. CAA11]
MSTYLFRYKGRLALVAITVFLASLLNVGLAFVFKAITDTIGSGSLTEFYRVAALALGFIVFGAVVHFLAEWAKSAYIRKTMVYLKDEVFRKIMGKSIAEFSSSNSAKYLSVINNDLKMVEEDYFRNLFQLFGTVVAFTGALSSMFFLSYKISLCLLMMTVISILIPRLFERSLSGSKNKYAESLEHFMVKVNDLFSGFQVIKSFKIERKIEEEYTKVNQDVERRKFRFNVVSCGVDAISEVFGGIMFNSVFIIGGIFAIQGELTLGMLLACVQLTNNVVNPIYSSVQYLARIKSLKQISGRIITLLNEREEQRTYTAKDHFDGVIEWKNVSFGYDDQKKVLSGIDLLIRKNQKVAFVGASGSGKSTLLKLLLKQYEHYDGAILIDGIPLKDISADDVYHFQSILHQHTFLFDSSINENIKLFGDYTDEDVARAAEHSGMTRFLDRLPDGLDSLVGENGSLLSGGEKQRIAIARTLIRKAPILMLDEATSALDNETAYAIEETILNMKEVTALVVTHRLVKRLLERYDAIYVLQGGEIIERGTFQELMDQRGYFHSLYSIENKTSREPARSREGLLAL